MTKYFKNPKSLEELRRQYKDLLKQYHPDNPNGSTIVAQAVNVEYDILFSALKDVHDKTNSSSTSKSYDNMKWDYAEDAALRNMLDKVIHLTGINITIVGNWIWIDGDTYGYKSVFKVQGFRWAHEKKKWYWHSETFRKKSRKKLTFDTICNYYGSANVSLDQQVCLDA